MAEDMEDIEINRKESQNSDGTFKENTEAIEELFEKTRSDQKSEYRPKAKDRRKGVWKLVKQRPVDRLEGSESQNYFSVLNMFDEIKKENNGKGNQKVSTSMTYDQYSNLNPIVEQNLEMSQYDQAKTMSMELSGTTEKIEEKTVNAEWGEDENTSLPDNEELFPTTTVKEEHSTEEEKLSTTTSKTPESIFDTLYSMFDNSYDQKTTAEYSLYNGADDKEDVVVSTTTLVNPTFPEEITEGAFSTVKNFTEPSIETTTIQDLHSTTVAPELPKKTFAVEPWEMKKVRTSTSTEVSHETEICYKGKCIKTKKGKIKV